MNKNKTHTKQTFMFKCKNGVCNSHHPVLVYVMILCIYEYLLQSCTNLCLHQYIGVGGGGGGLINLNLTDH